MWPDAPALREFLTRAWRRTMMRAAIDGVTAGVAATGVAIVLAWLGDWRRAAAMPIVAVTLVGPVVVQLFRARRRRKTIAIDVERRAPDCRNVVVTAAELLDRPSDVRPDIGAMVCRHAVDAARRLNVASLFPIDGPLRRLAVTSAVALATAVVVAGRPAPVGPPASTANAGPIGIGSIDIVVTPPPYARLPGQTLRNPTDVVALAGSRVQVRVRTNAALVTVYALDVRHTLARGADGEFAGIVVADRDGYIAIEAATSEGQPPVRRLIGLGVTPDRAPVVRLTKPGHDLFVTTASTLAIEIAAEDDLGLASLALRYTKVTGSEENFEFADGTIPLTIARESDRRWTAKASWALAALNLAPGNMVVYRAVAADHRPGAPPIESDSFIVQIVTPDRAMLEGFLLDDDPNRYAISQQMVILKTERLLAKRATMPAADFAEEALTIAAEQRRVRAEFIFMMGGEMADLNVTGVDLDETAEAEHEHELAEGRLQNQGRLDLIRATRYMSRAAGLLAAPDAPAALAAEKSALAALQRAFARSRYLLRTLSTQQQLDLSRRLGGRFTNLARDARPVAAPAESPRLAALRRALDGVVRLAGADVHPREDAARALELAEAILRVDAASAPLRQVASALSDAAAAIAAGRPPDAWLDRAAAELSAIVRQDAPDAPVVPDAASQRLRGLVNDTFRRGGDHR